MISDHEDTHALLLSALLAGCTRAGAEPVTPARERPVLEARAVGAGYGTPPMRAHALDVTLRNPATEPRWFVLPRKFPYLRHVEPGPGGDETELHVLTLSEEPKVILVAGTRSNLWAVKLPGSAVLTLHALEISSSMEHTMDEAVLEVIVARELRLGGRPLAEVVGQPLDSEGGIDLVDARGDGDALARTTWRPPDGKPTPLTIEEESRARAPVSLKLTLQ
jgi:hypothetical protein